jgi:hypothetical protein
MVRAGVRKRVGGVGGERQGPVQLRPLLDRESEWWSSEC